MVRRASAQPGDMLSWHDPSADTTPARRVRAHAGIAGLPLRSHDGFSRPMRRASNAARPRYSAGLS
ncbi:hypothetical protein B7G54_07340 [Burkholderia puraquae]|uniref:Uncharacterized protein n=1 Tax=Burkholderia puraquae TaxID=1904757 RepID=A0A1X1PKK3_9BURK|nr:hypothetical protein B7G54_07340 [Burkholderia puraquae]